ncbi:MAG TPA: malonyl-[acyl-carrier protein] O-methyltransferase BioC, partial [Rhodocyclaceae bacterium]|nr:malonyl-[acyl-carrier protein] O-methyltransferase BioC [Rhodocyclaceae bacterium]
AYRHTLPFLAPEEVAARVREAGFSAVAVRREAHTSHHPSLKALLGAVKAIGANQVGAGRRPGLMSRSAWQRAEAAYESLRQPAGLPLTYDVITIHAQK